MKFDKILWDLEPYNLFEMISEKFYTLKILVSISWNNLILNIYLVAEYHPNILKIPTLTSVN